MDKLGQTGLPLCRIRRKPRFVPGTTWVCPRDKLGLSLGQTGGCPKGRRTKKFMFMCLFPACAEYVSFELFWGILRGLGRGEGEPLLRCLCKTHRSLHGNRLMFWSRRRIFESTLVGQAKLLSYGVSKIFEES